MYGMDSVDLQIVELLLENARMSLKDIASKVYLTSPAVSARIDKLERAGVIEGYHAKINMDAVLVQVRSGSRTGRGISMKEAAVLAGVTA